MHFYSLMVEGSEKLADRLLQVLGSVKSQLELKRRSAWGWSSVVSCLLSTMEGQHYFP